MFSLCWYVRVVLLLTLAVQWFLELWNVAHAVLGLTAIIFIQRALQKSLIPVFLSRELKHEETNPAWWSGHASSWSRSWRCGSGTCCSSLSAVEVYPPTAILIEPEVDY